MNSFLPASSKFALCCYSSLSSKTEELPAWVDKVISEDLEPFIKGEKEQPALDILPGDAWLEVERDAFLRERLCRFSIRSGEIRHCDFSDPMKHIWRDVEQFNLALHILGMHVSLPDVDFFYVTEGGRLEYPTPVPTLAGTVVKPFARGGIRNVYFAMLMSWARTIKKLTRGAHNEKWEDKIDKLYWRGTFSLNKYNYLPHNQSVGSFILEKKSLNFSEAIFQVWDRFTRARLILLNSFETGFVDAKFIGVFGVTEPLREMLLERGYMEENHIVKISDQLGHKYLINIDGTTMSNSFFWMAHSRSVLIKPKSPIKTVWSDLLRPGKNFLEVEPDLSDLIKKLQYLRDHPEVGRRMVDAMHKEITPFLNTDFAYKFLYRLLKTISNLQAEARSARAARDMRNGEAEP